MKRIKTTWDDFWMKHRLLRTLRGTLRVAACLLSFCLTALLLFSMVMSAGESTASLLPGSGAGESLEQQVYLATFDTIRHIAEKGPCVIIGRCADYALADNPNRLSLFIHAPLDVRIARVAERQDVSLEKARVLINKTDKRRASYYEYYSSQKWGAIESYDYCLDSSYLGLGGTVELIRAMVEHKEHPVPSPTEIDPTRPPKK